MRKGSLESLNVCVQCGWAPNVRSQRLTVLCETPSAWPSVRVLQCEARSGRSCRARLIRPFRRCRCATAPDAVLHALHAALQEAPAPLAHGLLGGADVPTDRGVADPFCASEDHLGALRHVVAPLVAMELDLLVAVAGADPAGGPDAAVGELLVSGLVAAGLTDEEEVRAEAGDEFAEGLAALQVIAEQDRPVGGQCGDVGGQPALGGVAFAVLLALAFGQGRCDPTEVVQKGIEHWTIRNGGHSLCLEAMPAMLGPQKLVPCCRPSAARETPKGQI